MTFADTGICRIDKQTAPSYSPFSKNMQREIPAVWACESPQEPDSAETGSVRALVPVVCRFPPSEALRAVPALRRV